MDPTSVLMGEVSQMARAFAETQEQFMPDPHLQAKRVRAILDGVGSKLKAGEEWYVVSMRWWNLWTDYTHFNEAGREDDDCSHAIRRTHSGITKGTKPPEIDNSDLTVRPDSSRLLSNLMEHRDFTLLHSEAWLLLYAWYGGGPPIKRRVISVGSGRSTELRLELYPLWLSVYKVDLGGIPQKDSKMEVTFSRAETVEATLKNLCTNMEIADSTDAGVRLWHRASLEVDQTDIEALDGWTQLQPSSSTLEDLAVVDGASLLLEQPHTVSSETTSTPTISINDAAAPSSSSHTYKKETTTWPFFHRLRIDYKNQKFKDPGNPSTQLEVDDRIDCSALVDKRQWDMDSRSFVQAKSLQWFGATVISAEIDKILLQFHNREKPAAKQMSLDGLIIKGQTPTTIEVGQTYEAKNLTMAWHPVRVKEKNADGATYVVTVLDEAYTTWQRISASDMRTSSTLTEEAKQALTKVFDRYASDGKIEAGPLRGLMSCATNEYIQEDSRRVKDFLEKPYGDGTCVERDAFLAYWHARMASGSNYFVQQELGRLFDRVGANVEKKTEEEELLMQGREWLPRNSPRLAQYRSNSEPSASGSKSFRDFRRWDDVDVNMDGTWKQATIDEVNWTEMTVLVRTKNTASTWSSTFVSQKEWIPMESERLTEYQTKSLEGPCDETEDPVPLLARSVSSGGVCQKIGACGLQNIGNTCFMNSTLQCLSNTPELRFFFAGGPEDAPPFASQICTSPLSMQGQLAKEFSRVLRQMWSNSHKSIAPAQLKKLIGQKRPEFSGYQQHDAQELLSFLLDGLHEDVNRAPYPPANTEEVEDDKKATMSDEEVAALQWDAHLKRNNSAIVETFQFQIRSELECPVCKNISVTFDPIMYLSLPVPKPPHSVSITVCPLDYPQTPMKTFSIEMPKTATFAECEVAVWAKLGRSSAERPSCFSFADVYNDRIFKSFEKSNSLADIRVNDKVFAIEVQLARDVPEATHTFVPVVFRKRTRSTTSASSDWQYDKCAPPRVIAVTKETTNAEVHSWLKGMAEAMLKGSKVTMPWDFLINGKMDTFGYKSGEELVNDSGKFVVPENVGVDFLDERVGRDLKNGLPDIEKDRGGVGADGCTTLYSCLTKYAEREQLSEMDTVYCRKCKEHQRQFKKLELWSLPKILVVHFKRFGRDRIDGPLVKIECPIEFPLELDLSQYLCKEGGKALFDLYGVVNHHGGVGGGHYTAHAIVTTPTDRGENGTGEWFDFNDGMVSRASEHRLDKEAAYLLFYHLRDR